MSTPSRRQAPALTLNAAGRVPSKVSDLSAPELLAPWNIDKELLTMRNKDQAGVDGAIAEGEAQTTMASAIDEWFSFLGGLTPSS